MRTPNLLLPLLFLSATTTSAQHQFFYKDIIDKNMGLTATPTCMAEDHNGFFWIGTAKGLFRFDGSWAREIPFAPNDSLFLPSKKIYNLALDDSRGLLWLATGSGIFKYHLNTGTAERLAAERYFSRSDYKFSQCSAIFRDRQGELWANFAVPGLVHLKDGGRSAERFTCEIPASENIENEGWTYANSVNVIIQDSRQDSIIWAGTRAGLIKFNKTQRSIRHYYFAHPDKLVASKANAMQVLFAHPDGLLYIGTYNGGLLSFDPATERFEQYWLYPEVSIEKSRENNVNYIFPASGKKLWITKSDELLQFDTETRQFAKIAQPGGIEFIDKQGNYWNFAGSALVLYHRMKNQIRRYPFPDHPSFRGGRVLRIWEDTASQVIYTRTGELAGTPVFDRQTQQWTLLTFPTGPSVEITGHVLEKTAEGILVNDRERLYLLPPGARHFKSYPIKLPEHPGWLFSQKAPDGSVYISGHRGYLFRLKPGSRNLETYFRTDIGEPYSDHFNSATIDAFDKYGRVWIQCQGGFSIFIPGENRFLHLPFRQNPDRNLPICRSLGPDKKGRMWGLGHNEIGWIDPDHPEQGLQQRFGKNNGFLLDELAGRLEPDINGMFWFKSDRDLIKFDPESHAYTIFEGMGIEAITVLDGGEIAFQSKPGIGIIHPDSLKPNTERPQPYVAWFKVFENEKALSGDLLSPSAIRLAPDENFFSIGFSALGFFNPQKFRFAYQLVGVDKDWVHPEPGDRIASYTDVRGGDYTFLLKVTNSLGVWNETPFEWRIVVGTPWWAAWWFRLILVAAVAGAIYYLVKNRIHQQQILIENQKLQFEKEISLRNERDRIAAEMHDDLGAGLSTIRFLSLMAKEKENDPAKSERIDKIAFSAAEVMEKMADIIWVMNSRNDTLENFINYFRRYAGDYLDTHGIRFFFEKPADIPAIALSGEQRRTLLLALKESLHNVVKHADATEVHLRFSLAGRLEISITDNGKGIRGNLLEEFEKESNSLTGNGLHNLRQRMESLGGTAELENHGGARVILRTGIVTKTAGES